jgi:membrane fusion protein, heavy metal efflux system
MKSMYWIPMLLLMASCSRPAPEPVAEPEIEPLAVTQWTAKTELFAEYPPLVVGQTSRFAIHLTRLDTYKALTAGRVEVHLTGGTGSAKVFSADAPSRPGIFGVDVTPTREGSREMAIVLRLPGLDDEHRVGGVTVYRDQASALAAPAPDAPAAETISFLKEPHLCERACASRRLSRRGPVALPMWWRPSMAAWHASPTCCPVPP